MVDGVKVKSGLFYGISGGHLFILRAKKLEVRVVHAHFHQYGLQQFPVGLGKALSEDSGRHTDKELSVLTAFLSCGSKPCGETVRIDPPLHVLQYLVPRIHTLKTLIF